MQPMVARIGRAHGLRGEVTVQVHTDAPQHRFVPGAVFDTDPESAGPLTLLTVRDHNGITLLGFEEARDRTAAEALRHTRLFLRAGQDEEDEEDAWYESELVDLPVFLPDGSQVAVVAGLESRPAQDLLVLRLTDGSRAWVPFVSELVPEVDTAAGRVVIDPPAGLLELGAGEQDPRDEGSGRG